MVRFFEPHVSRATVACIKVSREVYIASYPLTPHASVRVTTLIFQVQSLGMNPLSSKNCADGAGGLGDVALSGTIHNPIILSDIGSTAPTSYDDALSSSCAGGDLEIIAWSSSINTSCRSQVCPVLSRICICLFMLDKNVV